MSETNMGMCMVNTHKETLQIEKTDGRYVITTSKFSFENKEELLELINDYDDNTSICTFTRKQFLTLCTVIMQRRHPDLRKGQHLYNVLVSIFPICGNLSNTECDCYYNDSKIDTFITNVWRIIKDTSKK